MRDLVVGEVYVSSQEGPPNEWQRLCRRVRLRSKTRPYGSPFPMEVKDLLVVEFLLTAEDRPEEWYVKYPRGAHPPDLADFFQPEEGGIVIASKAAWLWEVRPVEELASTPKR